MITLWQKQPFRGVLGKRCSENIQQIYRRTPILCNFIEIALRHRCSPVDLLHIFRTPFQQNTSEWLLLIMTTKSSKPITTLSHRSICISWDSSSRFIEIFWLPHDLIIAKFEACVFDNTSLKFFHSYFSNRKQRVKIESAISEWIDILAGIPQNSILGPPIFNIFINCLIMLIEKTDIYNFADDNTYTNLVQTCRWHGTV